MKLSRSYERSDTEEVRFMPCKFITSAEVGCCLLVVWLVCLFVKLSGGVEYGSRKNPLHSGADQGRGVDPGIFSHFL